MSAATVRADDPIGATIGLLAQVLTDLGWPVATDPDLVLPLVSRHGFVAFIDMPKIAGRALGGRIDLELVVHLCTAAPRDVGRLYELIPATIVGLSLAEPLTPQTLALGEAALPGYRLTTTRRIPC